jgi:hypothetical protein
MTRAMLKPQPASEVDFTPEELDAEISAGAIAVLRKRAAWQAAIARAGVVVTETGVVIRTGESAIHDRLAEASPRRQPKSKC